MPLGSLGRGLILLLVVNLNDIFGALDLMFQLVVLGSDVFLQNLRAANVSLLVVGRRSLNLHTLLKVSCKRVDGVHDGLEAKVPFSLLSASFDQ
jgi:hypothetical protein